MRLYERESSQAQITNTPTDSISTSTQLSLYMSPGFRSLCFINVIIKYTKRPCLMNMCLFALFLVYTNLGRG